MSIIKDSHGMAPDRRRRDRHRALVETRERRLNRRNVFHVVDLENWLVDDKWQDRPPAHHPLVQHDTRPDDVDVSVLPEDFWQALARLAVRLDDSGHVQDRL